MKFEGDTGQWDLMQPRPLLVLDNKDKSIGEYFEGSDNEVITVRELWDFINNELSLNICRKTK